MSNRPVHPLETTSTVPGFEQYLLDGVMVMKATETLPGTAMRPLADDFQPPNQGTTTFGYDQDMPTTQWQPDADRTAAKDQQAPEPAPPPFPAIDVRVLPHGLVRTAFRTIIGTGEVFAPNVMGSVYTPSVRQLLPRDLNRQRAVIRPMSTPSVIGTNSWLYAFAISADKSFNDYMILAGSATANADGVTFEIDGTDELWCAIIPMTTTYDPTKFNLYSLGVMWETIVTADGVPNSGDQRK